MANNMTNTANMANTASTKKHSRFETARKWLLFWCLFIGIGAVAGATGMLVAPDGSAIGMQAVLPSFQVLPFAEVLFQDFIFPGIALLCVNGITNLVAAALILARKKAGIVLGGVFGITLMLWICIQFVIFEFNFMSTAYFIFGLIQAATGYAALIFFDQERFAESLAGESYPNIGADPSRLVVFFSRMGYSKKLAYEAANAAGAEIYEIIAKEPTAGTKGFWWCGRFGMHGWEMPIEPIAPELASYEHVTICSPIWVFNLAGPVKSFCKLASGKIKSADYILVHHQPSRYQNAIDEMDSLLGLKHTGARSVRCHAGKFS